MYSAHSSLSMVACRLLSPSRRILSINLCTFYHLNHQFFPTSQCFIRHYSTKRNEKNEKDQQTGTLKINPDTGNKITYLQGDATIPQGPGHKIIAHISNVNGGWGRGFVLALTKRFGPVAEKEYKRRYNDRANNDFGLGKVQFVPINSHITVANMLAQDGYEKDRNKMPSKVYVQYGALQECLMELQKKAMELNASIHMPRIGAGLGGGKWDIVEAIIVGSITAPVYVYDFE